MFLTMRNRDVMPLTIPVIDYAMLKHAEGNWMSNFYGPDEVGDLK